MFIYVSSSVQPSGTANSIQSFYQYTYLAKLFKSSCYFHASTGRKFCTSIFNKSHLVHHPTLFGFTIPSSSIFILAIASFLFIAKRLFLSTLAASKSSDCVYSRNLYCSFLLSLFRIKHVFEIHSVERGRLQSYFLRRILISHTVSKVFISESLKSVLCASIVSGVCIVDHDASLPLDLSDAASQQLLDIFSGDRVSFNHLVLPQANKTRLFYAGTFAKGRGIELIFSLASKYPCYEFVLAGDSQTYLADREVPPNILLLGMLSHLQVLSIADQCQILLMPYQRGLSISKFSIDSFDWMSPLKLFDYMRTGRPIISSFSPSLYEVLRSGAATFVYDISSLDEWYSKVQYVVDNYSLMSSKSLVNKNLIVSTYNWAARATRIKPFLNETL